VTAVLVRLYWIALLLAVCCVIQLLSVRRSRTMDEDDDCYY
jgi:hypothetical protein